MSATTAWRPSEGCSRSRRTARYPTVTSSITSEYMRVSEPNPIANGEAARISTAIQAPGRPATRRPANHIGTSVATDTTPDSERTAKSEVPNTSVHASSHRSLRVAKRRTMPAAITTTAAATSHRLGEPSSAEAAPSGGLAARAGASEATFIAGTVTAATGSGGFVRFLEVPPLDLDHHRQQVPHVEARDREHAVVGDLAIDDIDAV